MAAGGREFHHGATKLLLLTHTSHPLALFHSNVVTRAGTYHCEPTGAKKTTGEVLGSGPPCPMVHSVGNSTPPAAQWGLRSF